MEGGASPVDAVGSGIGSSWLAGEASLAGIWVSRQRADRVSVVVEAG
jgi:hypothetical protein